MDFSAAMSAAMGKSKPTSSSTTQSKYLKRSEVEAQREAAYQAEQNALERSRLDKLDKKRKHEEDEAERKAVRDEKRQRMAEESRARREEEEAKVEAERRKRLGLPALPPPSEKDEEGPDVVAEEDIEDEELQIKLRELGEPTIYFAETHAARLKRYRVLTAPKVEWTKGPIPTTLKLLPEKDMRIPEETPKEMKDREYVARQLASYFTLVLVEWIRDLAARPQEVIESSQGRQAEAAMEQSRENLKPLFRAFESGELKDELLKPVMDIVRCAQSRRYVDANKKYLELSIGKAAWPIGVVSVGIHARASRSRIGEEREHVAHIMGDEVSRRWLQAIKRCITYAQTRWPPDDHMQLMG